MSLVYHKKGIRVILKDELSALELLLRSKEYKFTWKDAW